MLLSDFSNPSLARAVSRQVGSKKELIEIAKDVSSHGADSGFSGFIYYADTVAFFRRNRTVILESLQDDAENFGKDVLSMVASFNCIKGDCSLEAIGRALYGRYSEDLDLIYNCLAWYALEKVCQDLDR